MLLPLALSGAAAVYAMVAHCQDRNLTVGWAAGRPALVPAPSGPDVVEVAAVDRHGRTFATGSQQGVVALWRSDGTGPTAVGRHRGAVHALVFDAGGAWLASASADGTVGLWETAPGRGRRLAGHAGKVWAVAFGPRGDWLASAGDGGEVRLWSTAMGRPIATLAGLTASLRVLSVSPVGDLVAAAGEDGAAAVWDVASGGLRTRLAGHRARVGALALSGDGRWVATGSYDQSARVWDLATGRCLPELRHEGRVERLVWSPEGRLLVTGTGDLWAGEPGRVRVWELVSGRLRWSRAAAARGVWVEALRWDDGPLVRWSDGRLQALAATDGADRRLDPARLVAAHPDLGVLVASRPVLEVRDVLRGRLLFSAARP